VPTPTPTPAWIHALATGARWVSWRLRPDHSSLYGGWYQQNLGGRQHLNFAISCAPRRRLRKPRRVDPLDALSFLNDLVPDGFSSPATTSYADAVAFETEAGADDPAFYPEPLRAGRVWSNGRVELFVRAPIDGDEVTVDLAGAFAYAYRFVSVVNGGGYQRLYRFRTRAHRLDWFISLGNNYSHPQFGSRQWCDLAFPGRRPIHRATASFAHLDQSGLAWRSLRSRRQSTSPETILAPALTELVRGSGWYDGVEEAVGDTVDAAAARVRDGAR
jgi:hypothetical protein